MNRRKFIDRTGRSLMLGGLAFLGGVLITRRQLSSGDRCPENFQCKNCRKLSRCSIPEAEIERQNG